MSTSKPQYWSPKVCRLIGNKLYYSNPKTDKETKGVIDFDLLTCALEVGKGESNTFRINVFYNERAFTFRAKTQFDAHQWIKAIHRQILASAGYHKGYTKLAIQPKFWKHDRISNRGLVEVGNTGDIILFRSYGFIAGVQRFITCSAVGTALAISSLIINRSHWNGDEICHRRTISSRITW